MPIELQKEIVWWLLVSVFALFGLVTSGMLWLLLIGGPIDPPK